jgi:hypothetical protein
MLCLPYKAVWRTDSCCEVVKLAWSLEPRKVGQMCTVTCDRGHARKNVKIVFVIRRQFLIYMYSDVLL